MRLLGIDPGLNITGYGCVEGSPERPRLVEAGVFRLGKQSPGRKAASIADRLDELDRDFRLLLERLRPEAVGVEALFAHYKHPTTAIVMGHARGVLLLAIRQAGLDLVELKPTEVKKSLTGHGHASKEQMQESVRGVFGLAERPEPADVADAIAVALCARRRLLLGERLSPALEAGRSDYAADLPVSSFDQKPQRG